nr:uncharacterized protein LOC107445175 [Parasteatoda tepidariorum]
MVDHTIGGAPACYAASKVAEAEAMVVKLTVHAAANVVALFVQTLVVLQLIPFVDSGFVTQLYDPLRPCGELINVNIDMSNLEITTYNCSPKIESIELFGNIGGYVGMWLGISLVAVFDFLSTAFDLLKFPFRNFTIKKTRVHRINHQKRKKNNALNLENRIKWVKEFGELTNKKWNSRTSKPRGERFVCCLSYFKKSSVPTENFYGFLSGCYTFNTVFGRPNAKPSVVTSSGTIVLNISIDESEYIYLYHPPEGLISFHNPYHIVNPHMKGFSLSMKAQRHTFHLKKVVKKLLPYPYDTNCIDYLSRWKERGGKGPIDNEDCYNECQLNTSLKIYGCLNSALRPYSMESNTCAMDSFMISDNGTFEAFDGPEFKLKLDECVKKNCGPACYEESYQVIEDLEDVQNEASLGFHIKILFNIKNNC